MCHVLYVIKIVHMLIGKHGSVHFLSLEKHFSLLTFSGLITYTKKMCPGKPRKSKCMDCPITPPNRLNACTIPFHGNHPTEARMLGVQRAPKHSPQLQRQPQVLLLVLQGKRRGVLVLLQQWPKLAKSWCFFGKVWQGNRSFLLSCECS